VNAQLYDIAADLKKRMSTKLDVMCRPLSRAKITNAGYLRRTVATDVLYPDVVTAQEKLDRP
jgi:hypothetical protein